MFSKKFTSQFSWPHLLHKLQDFLVGRSRCWLGNKTKSLFSKENTWEFHAHTHATNLQRFSRKSRYWLGNNKEKRFVFKEITRDFHAHTPVPQITRSSIRSRWLWQQKRKRRACFQRSHLLLGEVGRDFHTRRDDINYNTF